VVVVYTGRDHRFRAGLLVAARAPAARVPSPNVRRIP
jgi:hypothetical protein